jgi:DNA-binding NarL/FixJ family response regulator
MFWNLKKKMVRTPKLSIVVTGSFVVPGKGFVLQLKGIGHNARFINREDMLAMNAAMLGKVDLLIMTSQRENINDGAILSWWKAIVPEVPLLIGAHVEHFEIIIEGIAAGVSGYISFMLEHSDWKKLLLETVINKNYYFDLLSERLLYSRIDDIADPLRVQAASALPPLAKKVFALLATAKTYEQIAAELQLDNARLHTIREEISIALSFKSRVGLALFYIKNLPSLVDLHDE